MNDDEQCWQYVLHYIVLLFQVNNGEFDCSDFSDECPKNRTITGDIFSSKYDLISNEFIRFILWTMAALATIGNLVEF